MAKQSPYEAFLKLNTGTHTARIHQLLVTPDEKSLITAGDDKTILVWDIESKKQTRMLLGQIGPGPRGSIQRIALSPDGKYLAALAWMYPADSEDQLDRDSELRVYDLSTGNLLAGFQYRGTLQDLDFSPDGKHLVMAGNPKASTRNGYVYIYAANTILKGFGSLPAPLAKGVIHETNGLIPSMVRFIPEKSTKRKSSVFRIVAATWLYGVGNAEYTGRLIWYSFSPASGLVKNHERDTEGNFSPQSLTVSREYVIITTHHGDNKLLYCHDHSGNLLSLIRSETPVAQPTFSKDEKHLIVGQRGDSQLVQIKVFAVLQGQFHLKSTYYGHDSEAVAVALLGDGTAVSAGGDQNAIHFWSTEHLEGEKIAEITGVGRTIHALGINSSEQIGIGNHDGLKYDDGRVVLQRHFDLQSMTLRPSTIQDEETYRRSQVRFEDKELRWIVQGDNANLWILPEYSPLTGTSHPTKNAWIWYSPTTFGFTENGSIITGAGDGKIRVAPRQPDGGYQTPLRLLGGYSVPVRDHASSGRWLATGGADQIIRLWFLKDAEAQGTTPVDPDKDTLATALNLFIGSDDEWVIWSKSGYYNASQRGDRRFGYHINRGSRQEALFFPSDRFIKSFFRPDIIQAILETGSEERAFAKIKGGGFAEPVDVSRILPPIIELTKTTETKKNEVTLDFTVETLNLDQPVTRVWIVQNERFAWEAPKLVKKFKATLPLIPGSNRIKILAESRYTKAMPPILNFMGPNPKAGQSESGKRGATSGVLGNAGTSRGGNEILPNTSSSTNTFLENREMGTLFLMAVGVSEFKDTASGVKLLKYSDDDAASIFNAFGRGDLSENLETKGRMDSTQTTLKNKAFESVEATILTNQFATKKAILDEVKRICDEIEKRAKSKKPKRDVFMVFLSGHGVRLVGGPINDLYFWNYDAMFNDLEKTGLSFMELGEKVTCVPAEVVLATDACHSGMAGRDVVRELDANELAKRIYAINERGLYILNAARSEEKAQEFEKISHGVFARSILDALNTQADPDISMIGLMDFVQRRMQYYMGVKQTPVFRTYGDLLPLTIYNK